MIGVDHSGGVSLNSSNRKITCASKIPTLGILTSGKCKVVYCVVTEANLGIYNVVPSRHYVGCCLHPDGLEFYQILCAITLPHFGHVGCKMSMCDDMSAK